MEKDDKDFLTDQFLQQFHEPGSQTKNYQLQELNQISQCIDIIKNSGELIEIKDSLQYILSHIGNLEFDDSVELTPYILNYALDFEHIEISVPSIHILRMLIKNDKQDIYEPIEQEFIQNAIKKSDVIFSYCQGLLSPQINDLIFSFIKFSNETIDFSLDSQLIRTIINKDIDGENLDQTILQLKLILNIAKLSEEILSTEIYQINSEICHKLSQIMQLNIPQLFGIALKIYDAVFRIQPDPDDHTNQHTYNSVYERLFDDFFHNYAIIFNEDATNKSFFMNILLNFSKTSFVANILNKYPIYDFIIPYLKLTADNIDEDTSININMVKLSWEIVGNFIFERPDQIKFAISNDLLKNAIGICEESTIDLKCSVIKFLSNILCCAYDPLIFKNVDESNLLEILLILVECLPINFAGYIIMSVIDFIKSPKISLQVKRVLKDKINFLEVHTSLTRFIELCSDEDICDQGYNLLAYLDGECDENLNSYSIEEEEEESEMA